MHFQKFSFGSIRIGGTTSDHDVVIDRGTIPQTKEKPLEEVSREVWSYASIA